jgi:hypothetical protein
MNIYVNNQHITNTPKLPKIFPHIHVKGETQKKNTQNHFPPFPEKITFFNFSILNKFINFAFSI